MTLWGGYPDRSERIDIESARYIPLSMIRQGMVGRGMARHGGEAEGFGEVAVASTEGLPRARLGQ